MSATAFLFQDYCMGERNSCKLQFDVHTWSQKSCCPALFVLDQKRDLDIKTDRVVRRLSSRQMWLAAEALRPWIGSASIGFRRACSEYTQKLLQRSKRKYFARITWMRNFLNWCNFYRFYSIDISWMKFVWYVIKLLLLTNFLGLMNTSGLSIKDVRASWG